MDLIQHLKVYKLRSKARIKDVTPSYDVLVSGVHNPWLAGEQGGNTGDGGEASPGNPSAREFASGLGAAEHVATFEDPRCPQLGVRALRPRDPGEGAVPSGPLCLPC